LKIQIGQKNPEFGLLDTILENHPKLIKFVEADILEGMRGCLPVTPISISNTAIPSGSNNTI